jgi:predicted transcriptional regulator
MSITEITILAPDILAQFPSHGTFTIQPQHLQKINTDKEIKFSKSAVENTVIVETTFEIPVVNEVIQYLVSKGFLVNMLDIKDETRIYWQLTDKGRDLKEVGSIEAYQRLEQIREVKKFDIQTVRKFARFWFRFVVAVIVSIAALDNIIRYLDKFQEVTPIDPPSPFFVCIWLNIIVVMFLLFRKQRKPIRPLNNKK